MVRVFHKPIKVKEAEHYIVYKNDEAFSSWPFNHGLWRIDSKELLVGFTRQECTYSDSREFNHGYVGGPGSELVVSRTQDGGRTWVSLLYWQSAHKMRWNCSINEAGEMVIPGQRFVRIHKDLPKLDLDNSNHLIACGTIPNLVVLHRRAGEGLGFTSIDGGFSWSAPPFASFELEVGLWSASLHTAARWGNLTHANCQSG